MALPPSVITAGENARDFCHVPRTNDFSIEPLLLLHGLLQSIADLRALIRLMCTRALGGGSCSPNHGWREVHVAASFAQRRGGGCCSFCRAVCASKHRIQLRVVQLTFRTSDDYRRDAIADHVHKGTCFAHEAIDSQNQRHSRNRYGRYDRESSDERDKRSTGDATRPF